MSLIIQKNSVESLWDTLKTKAFEMQQGVANCCSSDCKTYTLVVTGRLLQAVAVVGSSISLLGMIIAPVAFVGVVTSLVLGLLGTFMIGHVADHTPGGIPAGVPGGTGVLPSIAVPKPFVPGQPSGLINSSGNNCWLNAAMQCVIHVPALRQKAAQHPPIQQFMLQYQQRQAASQVCAQGLDVETLKGFLNQELHLDRLREAGAGNGHVDASVFLEWLLRNPALHQFSQTSTRLNGTSYTRRIEEPVFELDLRGSPQANAAQYLIRFFDSQSDDGGRIQLTFNALPPLIAFKLKRFYMHFATPEDRLHRRPQYAKISDAVEGLNRLTIPATSVATGQSGNYACNAFIVHYGSFDGGHYIAYVKRNGTWWCCNDSSVNEVSEQDALNAMKIAYFCFSDKM